MLGEQWAMSGKFAIAIAPWLMIVLVISPISVIFTVLEKQKQGMIANIIILTLRFVSLLVGGKILNDPLQTIILFSGSGFIFWIGYAIYTLRLAHVNIRSVAIYSIKIFSLIIVPLILLRFLLYL